MELEMKFSVIIPVYNVEPYLRICLDSVLAQTFTDWEAICVDDGSTDGSGVILDEYAARDSRFCVIHQENSGVCVTRQVGLAAAQGEYLGAVDADDWVDANYFEKLIKAADSCNADMVFGGFTDEYDDGSQRVNLQNIACDQESQVKALLEGRLWGGVPIRIFRRSFLSEHNISYPKIKIIGREDSCFVAMTLLMNPRIARCEGTGYHYRRRNGSVSHVPMTDEYYCSHLNVEDYFDSCFSRYAWARDSLLRSRQNVMIGSYLASQVHNKVFFSRCEKTLFGGSVPAYHKFMYWLALRGGRRFLIPIVAFARFMKNRYRSRSNHTGWKGMHVSS